MISTVAVAVERAPELVLDADYRIVDLGPAVEAEFGDLRGRSLWDAEPDARPLFEPHFESAWRSGEPVEFVEFYDGELARVNAVVRQGLLEVSWSALHSIDVVTLDGLWASLQEALAILERHEGLAARVPNRPHLYAVDGGRS
jgi:PAS fold